MAAMASACGTTGPLGPRDLDVAGPSPRIGLHDHGTAAATTTGVHWRTDGLVAAHAEAEARGRTVFAFVSTSWCGPCKRMKDQSFLDPAVARLVNDRLVPVLLDGERGEGLAMCGQLKINSYPTMVFMGPNGAEIDRAFGFHDARQLAQVIGDMLHERNTVGDLRRRVAASPDAIGLRQTLGLRLALRGDTAEAVIELEKVVAADPSDSLHQASQALFAIGRYVHFLKTADYDKAIAAYESLLARFPSAAPAREAGLDLARIRVMRSQKPEALAALTAMVAGAPNDAQRLLDAALAAKQHGLDLELAVQWARRATGYRGDGYPWFVLGVVQEARGDTAAALEAYQRAVALSPNEQRFKQAVLRFRKSGSVSI